MRLAFFPKNIQTETSDYELTMILHENGVISEMTIDYPDFTVSQTLAALEPLAADMCGNMKKDIDPSDKNAHRLGARPDTSSINEPSQPVPDLPLR
jgi:hypothetical protein